MTENGALVSSGIDLNGEVRIVEMPDHAFFVGALFVPQSQPTELIPHPFVSGFLQAVLRRRTVRGAGDPDLIAAAFTALAEGPGSPEFERLLERPARLL
jgi:hypothetical protein